MRLTSGGPAQVALPSATQPSAVHHHPALTMYATADPIELSRSLDSLHEAVLALLRDSWLSQVRAHQPLSPDRARAGSDKKNGGWGSRRSDLG
jgi:hypothetical protein